MDFTLNLSNTMLTLKFVINFIIMEATFLGFSTQDAMTHAGAACAIFLAFLLRIAIEWGKNELNLKNATIQAISTLALCFVSIYIWHDFLEYSKGFEVYVFFSALFSVFIVAEVEIVFKKGFKGYIKAALMKFMATEDKEVTK